MAKETRPVLCLTSRVLQWGIKKTKKKNRIGSHAVLLLSLPSLLSDAFGASYSYLSSPPFSITNNLLVYAISSPHIFSKNIHILLLQPTHSGFPSFLISLFLLLFRYHLYELTIFSTLQAVLCLENFESFSWQRKFRKQSGQV